MMNKKTAASLSRIILTSFVMLLSMAAVSSAADRIWDNEASDGNWNTGTNWDTNTVPTTSDYARIRMTTGPVFSGQTANVSRVYLETAGNGTLTMNSGTLNTVSHIYAAITATDIATINMNGGAINVGATFYVARDSGSNAIVNLSGGTITCAVLSVRTNTGAIGTINITGTGTLIITGDVTAYINTCITNGAIKAYDGAGTVVVSTITNPGKTTVTALPQVKAVNPSPANNATNVSTTADLSWKTLPGTASHDVYFGTDSNDVNNANRLLGDLDGDGTVDLNDISLLAEYWLEDPAGSDPYAGVNDDNIVNFLDYALFSNDWMDDANQVFKGNQDANTFDPTLTEGKIYYWRIDEVNSLGITTKGDVWKFTTQGFANVRKGPYLIYPGVNTQMTVLWQLDATTTSSNIAWGTDTSYSLGSVNTTEYNTGTDGHQHKYNITGLTPGTKYYYRVTISGVPYTGNFYAAPAADATDVKFFMYGDTRTNGGSHNSVAGQMVSAYTADAAYQTMVLLAGDWVSAGTEVAWTGEWYNYSYTNIVNIAANMPIMGAIGNHEIGSDPTAAIFKKYRPFPFQSATYFSYDYGPVHVAVVDQHSAGGYAVGSTQYNWLHDDLANSTKPWKIIVLHMPGWHAAGGHSNDTTVQTDIQPLCVDHNVPIVLGGHVHYYSRASVPFSNSQYPPWGYVQHVTSGGGGAPLYDPVDGQPNIVTVTKSLDVVKVAISGNTLTCTAISSTGTVLDTFTLIKP
jgi:hypothetical protein